MSAPEQKGWWYHATEEQRLAQIKAGIELGMSPSQVAMNCGCYYHQNYTSPGSAVANYARYHGVPFPHRIGKRADNGRIVNEVEGGITIKRRVRLDEAKVAYFAGEPVNVWAVK